MGNWVFDLVDANGQTVTEAGLSPSGSAYTAQAGSAPAVFECFLPLSDPLAGLISLEDDAEYLIKGYRTPTGGTVYDRELEFYGSIWVDELQGIANGVSQLRLTAYDQLATLSKRFTEASFVPSDMGLLLATIIDDTNTTDGETGIELSADYVTASSIIDLDARTNRPSIQSIMQQFLTTLDGVECWLEPIEYTAGKISRFYAAPRRGGAASGAVFGFGPGTESNCEQLTRTRDKAKIENVVNGYADTLTVEQKLNATSVAALRALVGWQSFTGETNQSSLGARTQGRLSERDTMRKISEYKATVGPDAPRLFDDYQIGDYVTLDFREESVEWNVSKRVVSSQVLISDTGVEIPGQVEFAE